MSFLFRSLSPSGRLFVSLLGGFACPAVLWADVVLTEVHYHPVELEAYDGAAIYAPEVTVPTTFTPSLDLTEDVHEFVEIQNTGTQPVDLSGWSLAGGIRCSFPAGAVIPPGAFRVIARNPTRIESVYGLAPGTVFGPFEGKLGNSGDTIRLQNANGATADALTYSARFPWPASADALGAQDRFTGIRSSAHQYKGRSLQRVSVTWPASDPANWLASPLVNGPTPGAAQATTRTVPKPVVLAHSASQATDGAALVRPGQAATVQASFSSASGLSAVQLEYFVDDVNAFGESRVTVAMTQLGNGGYSATIPGQSARSVVRYRFKADRGDGVEIVSPRPDDPQVAPIGTGGALEAWHGYFVTPVRSSSNPIYDVFVPTTSLTQLNTNISQTPRRVTAGSATGVPRDTPWVAESSPQWGGSKPAVFASNGRVHDIHIRYHGSRYHRAASNNSFKLYFPSHQLFMDQNSWFITGHGQEFIEAQRLNRLLGLPCSKMFNVDWYYNGNALLVRSQQGEFGNEMLDEYHALQQRLDPGGTLEARGELYKDVGNRDATQNNVEGPYTCGNLAPMLPNTRWTQLQRYEWTFSLQSNTWKGPAPIRDMVEGMWAARGDSPGSPNFSTVPARLAATKAWFRQNFDIETTLTSMALVQWMSIWDDGKQNQFYWRRANGQWSRLGWDYDQVMSSGGGGGGLGGGASQTIWGGENGATNVFDGVNWWKDTFYKCFREEFKQRLLDLNNSFCDPANLTAMGFSRAATFAQSRQANVNSQLAMGSYAKPTRPANTSPATGALVLNNASLATSAYIAANGRPHAATRWELRSAAGTYEEPLLQLTSTTQLVNLPVPFDQLTYGQTYFWRATHIDADGHASVVSAETSFTWGTSSVAPAGLALNEVLADNRSSARNGGSFPDYIELRNNSGSTLELSGYSLTDDIRTPSLFVFPPGTTLAAGAHLIVWADDDESTPGLHTGFGLDASGDEIILLRGATVVDSLSFGPQAPDVAVGRMPNGAGNWQATRPTAGATNAAQALGSPTALRLNEWMADPAYGEDWFEVYNADPLPVDLGGLYLSDSPYEPVLTRLPALSFIGGHGHTRFWADGSRAGTNHCDFRLGKSGDSLVLTAANAVTTLDVVSFPAQALDVSQGRWPDGVETVVSFTGATASPAKPNWIACPVRINEVLAHATSPFEDAIELHNPSPEPLAIGGWWLSNDVGQPKKYQVPAGTTLAPGAFWVAYAKDWAAGAVPFELDALGGQAVLSAVDASGALSGSADVVRYGAVAPDVSLGYTPATGLGPDSGSREFWPLLAPTFGVSAPIDPADFRSGTGAANSQHSTGPVVLNELMYHPPDGANGEDRADLEFIEIHHIASSPTNISGWKIRGESDYTFPPGTLMSPDEYALVVGFDPADAGALANFRATYAFPESVRVFGPLSTRLSNGSQSIVLSRPVAVGTTIAMATVDRVEYRDLPPWPTGPDGTGQSLQRTSHQLIGNTAAAWAEAVPTPGTLNIAVLVRLAVASTSPLQGGVIDQPYDAPLAASGGEPPYVWSLLDGAVPGVQLSASGALHGTPTQLGTFSLLVQAADTASPPATATRRLEITVAAAGLGITTLAALPDGTVAAAYTTSLEASGGSPPYRWSLRSGALPDGLSLGPTGTVSGTPTTPGTFAFTARVADTGGLENDRTFSINVPVPPLTITSQSPLAPATLGLPYSQALTSVGGVAPFTWSLASGSPPAGLTVASTGEITGTPTAHGTQVFTVKVIDEAGTAAMQALSLSVLPQRLLITTTTLEQGIVGDSWDFPLAAIGGVPPYAWSIANGRLPGGVQVSQSGRLTGTLNAPGSFQFSLRVTDSLGATADQSYLVPVATSGPMASLSWDVVPDGVRAGRPFGVRLGARDAAGRLVTGFNGPITLTAAQGVSGSQSPLLITEITDEAVDQFELQNVTSAAVNTTGWTVRIGDSNTDINLPNAITLPLPSSNLAAGGLLVISESNTGGATWWGSPINWSSSGLSRGWIMLIDAAGSLRDFAAFGWTAADLALLSVEVNGEALTPAGHWSGAPLAIGTRGSGTVDSWQRLGTSESNTATDWAWRHNANNSNATSFGSTNAGLTLPWSTAIPIALTPATAALSNGQFTGALAIASPANGVRLTAKSTDGIEATSQALSVAAFVDTDNDGLADDWESSHGLSLGVADGEADPDGDGHTNLEEARAGTDPQSASSRLEISHFQFSTAGATQLVIEFQAAPGVLYQITSSSNLVDWSPVGSPILSTAGGDQSVVVSLAGTVRFLRIEAAGGQ